MAILDTVQTLFAHSKNYNTNRRDTKNIKYIVMHYTGNVGDTAKNNADYYHREAIQTSAHYFVDEKEIWQSVPDNHTAYAVGMGARKEPYIHWPAMWKKITNANSLSIEICGSGIKGSNEGSDLTKKRGCQLAAELLHKYGLTPEVLYRHYDVTGKQCPAWAVKDNLKWLELKLWVSQYYHGEEDDALLDNQENYKVFKTFMERYEAEKAAIPTASTYAEAREAMAYCASKGIIKDGSPKQTVSREQLAIVIKRLDEKEN